jgi:branched-subunit amino acid transport protein
VSAWTALAITVAVGAMTYGMRAIVIVALADRPIPAPIERALRNVGPAVLAALAINLAAGGEGGPQLEWAEAAALVVAGIVVVLRRNILWTLAAGMATLLVLVAMS